MLTLPRVGLGAPAGIAATTGTYVLLPVCLDTRLFISTCVPVLYRTR